MATPYVSRPRHRRSSRWMAQRFRVSLVGGALQAVFRRLGSEAVPDGNQPFR